MSKHLEMIDHAQNFIIADEGQTTTICHMVNIFNLTPKQAENLVEQAVYLLRAEDFVKGKKK